MLVVLWHIGLLFYGFDLWLTFRLYHTYYLTEAEFHLEAEPRIRQVFVTNDPVADQVLAPNVAGKIFYSCEIYVKSPFIDVVFATASNLGNTGCYISLLYSYPGQPDTHRYILSVAKGGTSQCRIIYLSESRYAFILCLRSSCLKGVFYVLHLLQNSHI